MSEDEFDRTDPRDLAALFLAWKERERRHDFRFATLACVVVNMFKGKGDKSLGPEDIFESLAFVDREVKPEDIRGKIIGLAASLGADVRGLSK